MSVTLTSNGESFTFDVTCFDQHSLFLSLRDITPDVAIPFQGAHQELLLLDALLNRGQIESGVAELIEKYDVVPCSYAAAIAIEDDMRANMYAISADTDEDRCLVQEPDTNMYVLRADPQNDRTPLWKADTNMYAISANADDDRCLVSEAETNAIGASSYQALYYGLLKVEPETFASLQPRSENENLLFCTTPSPRLDDWTTIEEKLADLRILTAIPGVFVAGGCLYSILFGTPLADIDLFLWGMNTEQANKTVLRIRDALAKIYGKGCFATIIRTQNAITFTFRHGLAQYLSDEVQIILRLYQTPSEILHGFDVDSCCIGYDGNHLWVTRRALFALRNGYNTVNFDRLSPSYEARLAKYATRGMAVFVPDFERSKIDDEQLLAESRWNLRTEIHKAHGLARLILCDHYCQTSQQKVYVAARFHKEAKALSDYTVQIRSRDAFYNRTGSDLELLLDHCLRPKQVNRYRKQALRCVRLLADSDLLFLAGSFDGETGLLEELGYSEDEVDRMLDAPETLPEAVIDHFQTYLHEVSINSIDCENKGFVYFKTYTLDRLELILRFHPVLYQVLDCIVPCRLPCNVEWKTTNPGEQMTNTFHKIVLKDKSEWYNSEYYRY